MFRLLETIKIKDRELLNIGYHNDRINRSRRELFGITEVIDLDDIIRIPKNITGDIFKCRAIYNTGIDSIEFEHYSPRAIKSLKLVECNDIEYSYKYADRSIFDKLLKNKAGCDEILIVKNGFITDTSFSNVAFFDGRDWITPATPLLKGTKRAKLLNEGILKEAAITIKDLRNFQYVKLINAMLDLDAGKSIDISKIE